MSSGKIKLGLFTVGLWLFSFAVQSAEVVSPAIGVASTKPGDYLGQILVSLLLVLLIIFVSAWILKRYGRITGSIDGHLRVLGTLGVGQRERILLLQVGEEQLLVGVTTSQISMLHKLEVPIEVEHNSGVSISTSFSQRLQEALKQRRTGENS